MQLRTKTILFAGFGILVLALFLGGCFFTSNPAGFYDLGQDDRGGWFGGSTSSVRFYGGSVITVYASAPLGVYYKTNGQWVWIMDTGRELRIRPRLMSLECFDPTNPANVVQFRRVLPNNPGKP